MHSSTKLLCGLLAAGLAQQAFAENRTFTGQFSGIDPTMASTAATCFGTSTTELAYNLAGDFQVSESGAYEIREASNTGYGPTQLIDTVVLVYEGAFDPANSSMNLLAAVDYSQNALTSELSVPLEAGQAYTLVVQRWCGEDPASSEPQPGTWGAVIRGPGAFEGVGFPSRASSFGDFSDSSDEATFSVGNGGGESYKYQVGDAFTALNTGNHQHIDLAGGPGESPAVALFYEGSFDPDNTSANFVADAGTFGTVLLEAGTSYVPVYLDGFGENGPFQSVLYPAGETPFGTHLNGAWFNLATAGQGVLMDYASETQGGFLFLAWFTFDQAGADPAAVVGSGDQRWLTASGGGITGVLPGDVQFANTAGGVFNDPSATATSDTSYGAGMVEIIDCDNVVIDFDLADGVSGSMSLERGIKEALEGCYDQTPVGLLTP